MSWFSGRRVRVGLFEYGTVVRETFNCNGFLDVIFEDGRKEEVHYRNMIVLSTPIYWSDEEQKWQPGLARGSTEEYIKYNKSK
jgi:hypothetical protein